ncbi:hypothetical protein [Lachnospira multipara]|uniref:Uncharacterized protein n=1 Tax=Lachnospira multipara TaxID=28051 RepID=A0A1H5W4N0_9FIRM|nr:hypothetical protein [Lachnospira multipara]SEF93777.1 hypothetical protein SAMN05216537_11367 [Lachnospira multipara]
MTRGRVYLKQKRGEWIESTQLLYDMGFEFPYGNGSKILSGFLRKQLESKKKLDIWLKSLFQVWDKDGNIVGKDDQVSFLLGFDNVPQIDGVGDDYSYIMNCSSDKDIIYVAGEEFIIDKNEMIVLSFSRVVMRIRRQTGKTNLLFNEDEVTICTEALDFYSRIFIGQYDNIVSRLIWKMNDSTTLLDKRYVCEHILLAIRGIIMRDTDLDRYGFSASLGIWSDHTDIRAINSYDIQQVMRYNLAYAKHPEGGYTVDFKKPLINGNLPVIKCSCENVKDAFVETVTCTSNHLQVLDDALMIFYHLHSANIRELFEYYTDDELALELAGLIEKLFSGIKPDRQFVEEIKKVWEKVICAGGVFGEEK